MILIKSCDVFLQVEDEGLLCYGVLSLIISMKTSRTGLHRRQFISINIMSELYLVEYQVSHCRITQADCFTAFRQIFLNPRKSITRGADAMAGKPTQGFSNFSRADLNGILSFINVLHHAFATLL